MASLSVVKVGGSLFDWPDFPAFLRRLIAASKHPTIMVTGGGAAVDQLRIWSREGGLDDGFCHNWSLQVMTANAAALARMTGVGAVFPEPIFVPHHVVWLDALRFATKIPADELPANWSVSSDSVAALAGRRFAAETITLLKSIDLPQGASAAEAARDGLVDVWFPTAIQSFQGCVRWWNPRRGETPVEWDTDSGETRLCP